MCRIPFEVVFTSPLSLDEATATYQHKVVSDVRDTFSILEDLISGNTLLLPDLFEAGLYDLTIKLTDNSGASVTKKTDFKIGNCTKIDPNRIVLTDITAFGSNYELTFGANFALTKLYTELSPDGTTWPFEPIEWAPRTSPIHMITQIGFKFARLKDVSPSGTVYSNIYELGT